MQYTNLKDIVKYIYEEEIENDHEPEDVLKRKYDASNANLIEIFAAIDFLPDLIKRDGHYCIPKDDAPFIEWLIREYTSSPMQNIRRGNFYEAGSEYLHKVITGLGKILIDIGTDEIKIKVQIELIQKKTDYHLMVRIDNIRNHMSQILFNIFNYVHVPTFNLNFEEKCTYLDTVGNKLQLFDKEIQEDFSKLIKSIEKEIKEKHLKLTNDDMQFSDRTKKIHEMLEANQEFVKLRKELEELDMSKGFLKKTEKKKRAIVARMSEIKNDVAKNIPLKVDDLTMIEKLLYTTDTAISFTHKGGDDDWYVGEADPNNHFKGMIW
ncbi:hypothetical protein [Lacrimispora sp. 38-1]|uniref:hypothetical protein n=1 Tax=Lacrimispora sp. 38-1 TaxID=3125778 RepID=UPI003CE7BE30